MQTYRHRHMSECFGIMSIPPSASIVSWGEVVWLAQMLKDRIPLEGVSSSHHTVSHRVVDQAMVQYV